jgi:hypothetical protein
VGEIFATYTSDRGLITRILKKVKYSRINEPIKKWITELNRTFSSLVIKEMQIKTTLRFHFTPVRMGITKNTTNNKCWQGCQEKGTLIHCWWEYKLVQLLWKTIWRLLKKLNLDLAHDPSIPLLGIYPKECDSGYSKGTCTPVFIEALFTIAKLWKQPRCPTIDKWFEKMWYLNTMEFYSAAKMNEILSRTNKCIELENITLSKVGQAQMAKNHLFSLICRL